MTDEGVCGVRPDPDLLSWCARNIIRVWARERKCVTDSKAPKAQYYRAVDRYGTTTYGGVASVESACRSISFFIGLMQARLGSTFRRSFGAAYRGQRTVAPPPSPEPEGPKKYPPALCAHATHT